MTATATEARDTAAVALAYHARTKHSLARYAAGPETLDWDAQPNPFREFTGAPRTMLPLSADRLTTPFARIYAPAGMAPAPLTIEAVGALLELALGLSAWKEYGPDRWALRCNPSSGNLHPTEAYVVARTVCGIDDGVYHYVSRDHALEQRCRFGAGRGEDAPPCLLLGLSSVHWREAWKYGERAFRYCQLDTGHALGAIRYAAGVLGWRARALTATASTEIAAMLGLDRAVDFAGVEAEDAEVLVEIHPHPASRSGPGQWPGHGIPLEIPFAIPQGDAPWSGRANRLDPHPLYRWPVIDEVACATRGSNAEAPFPSLAYPPLPAGSEAAAAGIILGRRSAQRFDSKHRMSADGLYRLLDCLLPRPVAPWDVWELAPRLHPILFVHRVAGLEPGVYAFPRHPQAEQALRQRLRSDFAWQAPAGAPAHLPLFNLISTDCRAIARTVSCRQAIASDSCFSLSMLAEFEPLIKAAPWRYRQLHWEAGLIGQVLYLEAEAAGLRGTGIGCFLDDELHGALGLQGQDFQALYHFTVGRALTDDRIMTRPAYPGRQA